jgi:hypothetical protein
LAEALAGLKILVMSPPPSTCALPAPWQLSQVTPLEKVVPIFGLCGSSLHSMNATVILRPLLVIHITLVGGSIKSMNLLVESDSGPFNEHTMNTTNEKSPASQKSSSASWS